MEGKNNNTRDEPDNAVDTQPESVESVSSGSSDVEKAADAPQKQKRSWNPIRWQKVPPVPTERSVSKEWKASWLSKFTFHWIGSLMQVSLCGFPQVLLL